jgi:outer membrane lipoprotein SlyB
MAHTQQSIPSTIEIKISSALWNEFSKDEQVVIISKFPKIEIIPLENIGTIQSAQLVDRSTTASNSGAILGSAVGQVAYIDRAISNSGNNYSAATQLGVGILGAILGSTFDNKAQRRFIINYGIKTIDGQVREIRQQSTDEFTKPVGQCVSVPDLSTISNLLCSDTKVQFLKRISAIAIAPNDAILIRENSELSIKCNIPGIGMMTLEKNVCTQMNGRIEQ